MTRPTLVDVAREAGVSRATAARVLADATNVDARMTAAVMKAVDALGYETNSVGRSLRGGRAGAIALIVPFHDLDNLRGAFFTSVLKGAADELYAAQYQPILIPADHPDIDRIPRFLRSRSVDGAIAILQHEITQLAVTLIESPVPVAWVGRPGSALAPEAIVIDSDNYGGGALAARTLVEAGRRRLGIIAGPFDVLAAGERVRGWRDELTRLGVESSALAHGEFSLESGSAAMARMLEREPDLDGVFVSSDLMAVGALRVLQASGRRVPSDVSVIGFDDVIIATTVNPPLTTIRQPLGEMGRVAAQTVLTIVRGGTVDRRPVLSTNLVIRESV